MEVLEIIISKTSHMTDKKLSSTLLDDDIISNV